MIRDWGLTDRLVELRPDWSIRLWEVLSLPGDLVVIVAVLFVIGLVDVSRHVWRDGQDEPLCPPRLGSLVAVVFGGLAMIVAVEAVFGLARPPTTWHAVDSSPYGFPSGHTTAAVVCWGAVTWWYRGTEWHSMSVSVTVLVVSLVALSRLFLGVHYAPDVIVAVLLGAGYLAITARYVGTRPARGFAIAVSFGLLAVLVTGGSTRALLALAGTSGSAMGWLLVQPIAVRRRVRSVARSVR